MRQEIASIVGVHYVVVCGWIRAWQQGGAAAITLKKRGRGAEEQRLLTEAQESSLQKLLCDKNPKQL